MAHLGDAPGDGFPEPVKPKAGGGAYQYGVRGLEHGPVFKQVAFVQRLDHGLIRRAKLAQNLGHHLALAAVFRRGDVRHHHEQVRVYGLLQRGLERLDQRVGELVDKADRVHQLALELIRKVDPPGHGVEGGKELVLDQHVRPAEGV